jgi:hypothetical protein
VGAQWRGIYACELCLLPCVFAVERSERPAYDQRIVFFDETSIFFARLYGDQHKLDGDQYELVQRITQSFGSVLSNADQRLRGRIASAIRSGCTITYSEKSGKFTEHYGTMKKANQPNRLIRSKLPLLGSN